VRFVFGRPNFGLHWLCPKSIYPLPRDRWHAKLVLEDSSKIQFGGSTLLFHPCIQSRPKIGHVLPPCIPCESICPPTKRGLVYEPIIFDCMTNFLKSKLHIGTHEPRLLNGLAFLWRACSFFESLVGNLDPYGP